MRQAAIKELVSLRRLRALLCDQFENWHVRTNTFEWSYRLCISPRFEKWKTRERGCRGRMRRKRSSPDNLIIPTPDTIDIGTSSPLATLSNWLILEFPLWAFKYSERIGIYFLIDCALLPSNIVCVCEIQWRFRECLISWKRRKARDTYFCLKFLSNSFYHFHSFLFK